MQDNNNNNNKKSWLHTYLVRLRDRIWRLDSPTLLAWYLTIERYCYYNILLEMTVVCTNY